MSFLQAEHVHRDATGWITAPAFAVVAALVLTSLTTAQADAQERQCHIARISNGTAVLVRAGEMIMPMIGQTIQPGDRLAKDTSVQVSISCSDGGEITIGRGSEIDLGSLIAKPVQERRIFRLLRGIAGFVMPDSADPVDVQTMNAVAAVRSTEWTVEVEGAVTHVFVRKGLVQVTGDSGQGASLAAGEGISVQADGTLGPVKTWGQARIDAMNARLGGVWQ